jgi:Zn finger protein HypA/HybF involved in hydrogenase expression
MNEELNAAFERGYNAGFVKAQEMIFAVLDASAFCDTCGATMHRNDHLCKSCGERVPVPFEHNTLFIKKLIYDIKKGD